MRDVLSWVDGWPALVIALAVGLSVFGWYLSYLAGRLDRLHHRVEAARAALRLQLARRATAAQAVSGTLEPASGAVLAAHAAAVSPPAPRSVEVTNPGAQPTPRRPQVDKRVNDVDETAENELTRALRAAFDDSRRVAGLRANPESVAWLDELVQAGERVQLARRFHNDAVAHAQRMRRKRLVRWARLAGHARFPRMVEIDDGLPPGLEAGSGVQPVLSSPAARPALFPRHDLYS